MQREMASSLWRNRSLAKALIRREVIGRYRGSKVNYVKKVVFPLEIFPWVAPCLIRMRS